MTFDDLPKLQKVDGDKPISLRLDKDTQEALRKLKEEYGVKVSEWLRQLIKKGVEELRERSG